MPLEDPLAVARDQFRHAIHQLRMALIVLEAIDEDTDELREIVERLENMVLLL